MMVGVLGGGQLGRMLALAGYPLGLQFRLYDQSPESPAEHVAEFECGAFDDFGRLREFCRGVDVVTYEFENVPVAAVEHCAEFAPVFPPPAALATAQDRLAEKSLFSRLGIPTPKFAAIASRSELEAAIGAIGAPGVLKTCRGGYDGRGQFVLRAADDACAAWSALEGAIAASSSSSAAAPLILEQFVPFDRELSILALRDHRGDCAFYPLVENVHRAGILRESRAPAPGVDAALQNHAEDYARRVLRELNYVGLLAIEFFACGNELLANEMAPRVHNSGHWTIEGAAASQFENHLRAVLNLPLGSTAAVGESLMLNLIGTPPALGDLLRVPGAHVHLYGKSSRPGRKVGHVTVCADAPAALAEPADQLRRLIAAAGG